MNKAFSERPTSYSEMKFTTILTLLALVSHSQQQNNCTNLQVYDPILGCSDCPDGYRLDPTFGSCNKNLI